MYLHQMDRKVIAMRLHLCANQKQTNIKMRSFLFNDNNKI